MEDNVIIEMTPFIYEDGKTYYFQILKRENSNDYHDLYVYEKIIEEKKNFWGKLKVKEHYKLINQKPELVATKLNTTEIKSEIKKILIAKKAKHQLNGWDGFVGDIPEDVKKSLRRDSRLKDILE